jgi:two-component system cell cycle response regulator DivK
MLAMGPRTRKRLTAAISRRGERSRRRAPPAREIRRWAPPSANVLFVDDAEDMRTMYGRYLQFRGLRVATAADGIEALQHVDSEPPDVIVLDLAMPRVTGWDVIRELKSHAATRHIPIIALSGHDARESALGAGADVYRDKPCAPQDLLHDVVRFLRGPSGRGH